MRGAASRLTPVAAAAARLTLIAGAGVALTLSACGGGAQDASGTTRSASAGTASATTSDRGPSASASTASPQPTATPLRPAVGLRVLTFVDRSRRIALPGGGSEPRTLVTFVRYPALAPSGGEDVRDAPLRRAGAPYPLIVFGHGFAVTPGTYTRLLRAWARAGFVVAAPAFPLENARAPGGPDEGDLPNQPADMSFVITRMLAQSRSVASPLANSLDPRAIAVSGQSDGGDTALAAAYDPAFRDPRIGAAVILSGAEVPGHEFALPSSGPPLLATQGTADTINPPSLTDAFFAPAPRPKFELVLPGAEHLPPYTTQQPQLGVVERVSIDFLDGYLLHRPGAAARMAASAAADPSTSRLVAEP